MEAVLKVLLVEDNQDHAELILRSLRRSLPKIQITLTSDPKGCLNALQKKKFDLILMDYYLADSVSTHLLQEVTRSHSHIPVIVITGQGDERTAAKSIKAGAEDYVVKTRESLEHLPEIILKAIQKHQPSTTDIKQRAPGKKRDEALLSGFFQDIEKMACSLKTLYRRPHKKSLKKKRSTRELQKISLLEKQMGNLKGMIQKLLKR